MSNYYDSFVAQYSPPNLQLINNLQNQANKKFKVASTYYKIEEEISFGSLEFREIEVRITSVVDAKTGQRINDDFKNIIFQNFDYTPQIGQRYRFDDNIWIVYSTDNIKTATTNVYVRRCNNTINIQDKYGNIHKEPCVIDYRMLETRTYYQQTIDVSQGKIWIQVQNNDWTKNIDINFRVMFDTTAYIVRNRISYDKRYTNSKDSLYMLSFYAEIDNKNEYDNLELEIADYKLYNYSIIINNETNIKIGSIGNLTAVVYLDNMPTDEDVSWYSENSDIIEVTADGNYNALKVGNATIICKMKNKTDVLKTTVFSVVDSNVSADIILPTVDTVYLGETNNYEVFEYIDNTKTDTKFSITAEGVANKYYTLITTLNSFQIKCLRSTNDILKINCQNLKTNKITTKNINLRGVK